MLKRLLAVLFTGLLTLSAQASHAQSGWQGWYGGAFLGYGAGESRWSAGGLTTGDFDIDGVLGGIYGGHNWQNGNTVFGAELELAATGMEGTTAVSCGVGCTTKLEGYLMLKGRVGVVAGSGLFYGALGYGAGSVKQSAAGAGSQTDTTDGWMAALGYEAMMQNNWGLRVEGAYMGFSDVSNTLAAPPISVDAKNFWTIKIGITKHF